MHRLAAVLLLTAFLAACTLGASFSAKSGTVVEGPIYVYATASDCAWSRRTGPFDGVVQSPELRGVITELPPGKSLTVVGEDIGKDSLCYRVTAGEVHGYVLASKRVRLVRQQE